MKIRKPLYLILAILILSGCSGSRRLTSKADQYSTSGKYLEAIDLYNQAADVEQDASLLFKRGVAYYELCDYQKALNDLTASFRQGYRQSALYKYTGMSLHRLGRYSDAVPFYKDFLAKSTDDKEKHKIIEAIKRAGYGVDMQYTDPIGYTENLGSSVNTQYDEISPIESPNNPDKFYFSSNREGSTGGLRDKQGYRDAVYGTYAHDMYGVELINGNWTPSFAFDPILNTARNEIIQGFSVDGSVLFFKKSLDNIAGEIYMDTFQLDRPSDKLPAILKSSILSEIGDDDIKVYNDSYIIFSSPREGGYGGYDLYIMERLEGIWGPVVNMGPAVNSPYDERDPFLTRNGKRLFFSSDRLSGYGGYDVFSSTYDDNLTQWNEAENLGLPVNSPSDDRNFFVTHDGRRALFSSDRSGSYGGFDLYFAYLKEAVKDQQGSFLKSLPYAEYIPDSTTVVKDEDATISSDVQKQIVIPTLFYGADGNPLTSINKVSLDNIIANMKIFPKTSIIITGGSIPDGNAAYDLFFSLKRAEQVGTYLIEQGISPTRVTVRGLGTNFPLVKMKSGMSRQAEKFNRYIDLKIISGTDGLEARKERLAIPEDIRDKDGLAYRQYVNGLSYKIKIAEVNQLLNAEIIESYPSCSIDKAQDGSTYIYYLGIYDNYRDARFMKNELTRKGISAASIVPFIQGIQVTQENINELSESFKDLKEYILFEE